MSQTRKVLSSVLLSLLVLGARPLLSQEESASRPATPTEARSRVQLAVLLDSSSSMGGLIRQAQTQLWQIVNEFALAKGKGESVQLEVALYEYGKNTLPAGDQYIRKIVPLTSDLDRVSEQLFALEANTIPGGSEYCGAVIQTAVQKLEWSTAKEALKVIFVAGNEPFTQGPVDYRKACEAAARNAIIVNTVHCGAHQTGVSQGWQDGARLGEGLYLSIDQNQTTVYRPTPQDKEIVRLGAELNETYVPFGDRGRDGLRRQESVDKAADASGEKVQAERAISKGSKLYKNPKWDLVDAVESGEVALEEVARDELPKEMQDLDLKEKKAFVEDKAKARKQLQAKIEKLGETRRAKLATVSQPAAGATDRSLGNALVEALRKQSASKGIQLKELEKRPTTGENAERNAEKNAEKAAEPGEEKSE